MSDFNSIDYSSIMDSIKDYSIIALIGTIIIVLIISITKNVTLRKTISKGIKESLNGITIKKISENEYEIITKENKL